MFGIIGNGSWATALAKILTDNGRQICWWMRSPDAVKHLQERHHNAQYLTAVNFSKELIQPTTDLCRVADTCDTILICVPSAFIADVLKQIPSGAFRNKVIISAVKGILPGRNVLLNDFMVSDQDISINRYVAITGPCHAEEVAQERLSYLTFSGLDRTVTEEAARHFTTQYINTTVNDDLWGTQYAAVLKNIYAVGAGIAHGAGYGDNFLSVFITNCYREMYGFLRVQFEKIHSGNHMPDFHTSAYLGDLLVTAYSPHSRNRSFGTLLGKGYTVKSAVTEMNMVAEGYYAVRGMMAIAGELEVPMPIMHIIHSMLWEQMLPAEGMAKISDMLS